MDFEKYRLEMHRLYHEYLKLWQESGGILPDRLPGTWRPQYEKFELILDLSSPREKIIQDLDGFRAQILARREAVLQYLDLSFSAESVVSGLPTRSNMKKEVPEVVIRKAELALAVYRQKDDSRLSIAMSVFGFENTYSDQESKSAERQVRQYLSHAETLLKAAGNGTFFQAIETSLPKK